MRGCHKLQSVNKTDYRLHRNSLCGLQWLLHHWTERRRPFHCRNPSLSDPSHQALRTLPTQNQPGSPNELEWTELNFNPVSRVERVYEHRWLLTSSFRNRRTELREPFLQQCFEFFIQFQIKKRLERTKKKQFRIDGKCIFVDDLRDHAFFNYLTEWSDQPLSHLLLSGRKKLGSQLNETNID